MKMTQAPGLGPNTGWGKILNQADDRLFVGLRLRWHQLTQSEKVICGCILGIPLWWLWGWSYLFIALVVGLLTYEWRQKGEICLGFPSVTVLALMGFALYDLFTTYFYGAYYGLSSLSIRDLVGAINANFCPAVILWYIQGHRIRVRLPVVAWAFSVVVLGMAIGFLYVLMVKHQMPHNPYRSIFGALTKKPLLYAPGQGNTNYLLFYRAEDSSLPGLVRFSYFFHGPESLAVVTSFLCLLAADLRQKTWQALLLAVAFFLLLTSGTRSSWITLPAILLLRFFLTAGQHQGAWFALALMAITSLTTLVLPPVTHQVLMITGRTAQAATNLRADSSDTRSKIYRETLDRWLNSTDRQFFLGHVVPGESVMIGYAPAKVGTHSFYLGSLLYQKGIVGFCIFATYWLSLLVWLYRTRCDRPWCIFLIWCQLSLLFCIMAFESTIMPILLIGVTLKIPTRSTQSWAKHLPSQSIPHLLIKSPVEPSHQRREGKSDSRPLLKAASPSWKKLGKRGAR